MSMCSKGIAVVCFYDTGYFYWILELLHYMYGLFTFTTEIPFKGKTKLVPSIRSRRRGLNVIKSVTVYNL
jgi:hypothetical protein